ncbi:CoA transferase [Amycolatopsis nigrescens]|uniref:CoA transferase n=1 Tax=Amycolatopsis nigrescens TaxID=381445 RepID=UPI0003603B22|nr:CoA transferase [Amycolatopsis nigrescens]
MTLSTERPAGTPDCLVGWAGPVELPLAEESAVQAACGLMHVHGRRSGRPLPLAVDYATAVAGVLAAQGNLAARIGRARGLVVGTARTSVAQAALLSVAQYLAAATAEDAEDAEDTAVDGGGGEPPFASADGVRFELETLDAEHWQRFWLRLGADPDAVRRGWRPFQLRFATATCPLPVGLATAASGRPFGELTELGRAAGVSVLAVRAEPRFRVALPPWRISPLGRRAAGAPARPAGLPLDGIVVVESTSRVQGPLAGHLLRLLGADVVRIEPPGGDPMRGVPPMAGGCSARFRALNDGKRAVEIDLKSAAGRAEVLDLVAGAEVFLHNWAPGRAVRLGLDADDLAKVRPGLVYAAASGWGTEFGPVPPLGTDFLVQAHSGLAAALRPGDEPAAPSLMTVTDVLGGAVCAEGVLTALLARLRTGAGARVDSSLLSAAAVPPRPRVRPVWTMLDRPPATRDGYLALGARARSRPDRVAEVLGAAEFTAHPTAYWLERFAAVGLPVTPVCTDLRALAADPRFAGVLGRDGYTFPLSPWTFS